MIRLSEAEAEQEQWYNNTVRGNEREWSEPEYEPEEYGSLATDYESEEDSEDESEEEHIEMYRYERKSQPRFLARHETVIGVSEVEEEDEEYDSEDEALYDEEDEDGMFMLTRTTSHRPPSLCSDCSDDEDEESNPPSPPQPSEHNPPMTPKERLSGVSPKFFDSHPHPRYPLHHDPGESLFSDDRLLPEMIGTF